jgi:hypothetical protein
VLVRSASQGSSTLPAMPPAAIASDTDDTTVARSAGVARLWPTAVRSGQVAPCDR